MNVFWRAEPLTADEAELLRLCLEAHGASAMRGNASSSVLAQVAASGCAFPNAVAAGLMTLGGMHAPLAQTWQVLHADPSVVDAMLARGERIPGWGNSFVKGEPDPLWAAVAAKLTASFGSIAMCLDIVTGKLSKRSLWPNPSAYTAAVGYVLRMPPELLSWLFVAGRINAWAALFNQITTEKA